MQQTFDTAPAFQRSVEREHELLRRAARVGSNAARRRLTQDALAPAAARRQRYFVGAHAVHAPLEDVFLVMEGLGSFAAVRVALAHAAPGTSRASALQRWQQRGYWPQDTGLCMILVLDALLPGWRARVVADRPPSSYALLAKAVDRR